MTLPSAPLPPTPPTTIPPPTREDLRHDPKTTIETLWRSYEMLEWDRLSSPHRANLRWLLVTLKAVLLDAERLRTEVAHQSDQCDDLRLEVLELEAQLDPPVCRLQFPDGTVPGNAREAAEGWHKWALKFWDERDKLQAAWNSQIGGTVDSWELLHSSERAACERAARAEAKCAALVKAGDAMLEAIRKLNPLNYNPDDENCTCTDCRLADSWSLAKASLAPAGQDAGRVVGKEEREKI